jgi:DNA modification methylase
MQIKPYFSGAGATIYHGNVLDVLRELPASSVHCIVTSPPYWGLRDYGIEPVVWSGDEACSHLWGEVGRSTQRQRSGEPGGIHEGRPTNKLADNVMLHPPTGAFCCRCGAWHGSLGLEPTFELYVEHLVAIFREVRRVLRDDGTCWVNMGDSYQGGSRGTSGKTWGGESPMQQSNLGSDTITAPNRLPQDGLKPKDLCGIPWRVAIALQADGLYLRSDIIWHKPNPMPQSVQDRPTKAHEYLFLLSKNERYFYDAHAIAEPSVTGDICNKRSVWTVATQPFGEAHFATYPEALVEPCILAGTSERGCCPECGAPWVRVVERSSGVDPSTGHNSRMFQDRDPSHPSQRKQRVRTLAGRASSGGVGWRPGCQCNTGEPVPCTILDPFHGAGTTAVVALKQGCRYIGIELSEKYIQISLRRLQPQLAQLELFT